MNTTPRVSLHLVRGFWVAARQLSFPKAAAELFVTQSAVSREIKKLEEQLGQPLFRRVNRTLQLTQAGEELYRAVSEALVLIDAATDRLAGVERSLTVTTTIPLASLWLVPRLPRFTQQHPELDVRIVASNDLLDLVQAQVDIAIRYASLGGTTPLGKPLVGYSTFPVCTPALMRDPARPLRSFADLAQHVLLEFETTVHGRPWYDWEQWFSAVKTAKFKPAGRQRFSHYDQVVEAALAGSGVAIGKRPHLNSKLQAGTLCAPFGTVGVATLGSFHVVLAPSATGRGAVGEAFVAWLRSEVRRDERALAKKRD
ncbi:MAG: LysR family transcriptional regulator [Candidatus Accumulibacter sp.]|nr:LysR family transcriptional regulator [Accumulibacter sp.]